MKLKTLAVALVLGFASLTGVSLLTANTYAGECPDGSLRQTYKNSLAECNMPETVENEPGLMDRVVQIINVIVGVVGILAVIVIIIGAILYVTSTGEAAKTTRARNTMLYGVVGLVVALLAFSIVNFVLVSVFGKTGAGDTGTGSADSSQNADDSDKSTNTGTPKNSATNGQSTQ